MTRYKKRKIRGLAKFCIMLIFPLTAAGLINGADNIGGFMQKAGSISLGKNEQVQNFAGIKSENLSVYSLEDG